MDLKNTKEVLTALKDVGVFARKVLADGKVNLADLPALLELIKKADEINAGAKDIAQVVPEVKDLSMAEATELIAFVTALVKEVKEA